MVDEAGEVDGASIVAGSEATEMFEAAEASLDLIAMFVDARAFSDQSAS